MTRPVCERCDGTQWVRDPHAMMCPACSKPAPRKLTLPPREVMLQLTVEHQRRLGGGR